MRCKPFSRVFMAMLLFGSVILAGAPCGWASTVTVLYNFKDRSDGYSPSGVIMVHGKLYGTTATGGTYESGAVFELVHTKSGWVKKTLHEFTGGADGLDPTSGLVADKAGNLYGTAGGGVVFDLTRGSRGGWHFRVIYTFNGTDGADPIGLFFDAGSLYGTTAAGGGTGCAYGHGCGTVYELSPRTKGNWELTTLHDFKGTDGANPEAPLYRDAEGNLYGTTEGGGGRGCPGSFGCGTAFELSPSGGGWKFSVLHRFGGGVDGCNPLGPLVMDREGALYGTATDCGAGEGLVYRLTPRGAGWQKSVLYRFGPPPDAALPADGVLFGSDDTMYGTAFEGGTFYEGAIFKLERSGGGWKESVPFSFDVSDGFGPISLVSGGGKYYGTADGGGDGTCQGPGCGVVFEFVP